jgi:hypothetical protein
MGKLLSELNGSRLLRRRTPRLARWSNAVKVLWTLLQSLPPPARPAIALVLLVLLGLLAGCATQSPPDAWPKNPPPPALSEPLPLNSYSSKVETLFKKWRERLTGM